ncbi:hypothetical protein SUGI_0106560 [Cryptomeria japonica]|uniref:triacylglycerol lipase 1 n=1 Tax=Cryptomeria japonica TaxID=3369 RepID=UPI00240892EC|nr:triacylglycerol lipase 1 [Cryptomeria japonica]GLJ09318.1 hypothetical protein SUGI_0106560 [Cryptomeria japonica]
MVAFRNTWFAVNILLLCLKWDTLHVICIDLGSVQIAHPVANPNGMCATFVWSKGYDCAEFIVPTKDGFLLSMQRMSRPRFRHAHKEPVFLYHGIFQGGEGWLLDEPKESLAFILADSGYDVWIGSTRTTNFTYGHITYNRKQKEFWDWSCDELVSYDLPAMLYFVNNMTRQPIYYVGYSQGAMVGFAAFTQKEIAGLVKKAAMLSPVAYLNKIPSPLIRAAAFFLVDQVDLLLLHMYEFNPSSPEVDQLSKRICGNAGSGCGDLSTLVTGPTCCINKSRTAYYNKYRQSTATKNLAQLAQLLRSGKFGKYDYGFFGNLAKYWSISPPSYDLSAIPKRLPFFLAHGGKDRVADAEDVRHVAAKLPGEVKVLFKPKYDHEDFLHGTSSWVEVYPYLLEFFHGRK